MSYFSWNRENQVATRLLEHGADITLENDMGETPLDLVGALQSEQDQ